MYISWDVNPDLPANEQWPLKYLLKAIFTPSCWMGRAVGYNKTWTDEVFRLVLDANTVSLPEHHVRLGDTWGYSLVFDDTHQVWVANHPYASFTNYVRTIELNEDEHLPKRWVILFLADYLKSNWGYVINEGGASRR